MVLRVLIVAAAVLALAGAAQPAPLGGAEEAFVSVEDDDALVAVELDSGRVAARIAVADGPHNVAVTNDGRFVLATSPPAGAVTLVDAFTRRALTVFRGLRYPHDVEVAPSGRYAYVTEERGGTVAVLDLRRRRLVGRVAVGDGPHDLAVSPNGRRIWVTHGARGRSPAILDASRPARPRFVAFAGGGGEHDIAFARSGLFVWVTYWSSGIVGEIRAYARTGRLRRQEEVGRLVHHVYVDAAGRVWATDHRSGDVFTIGRRVRRLLSGCPGAHHVAVGPARRRVAVACHDSGTLLVYDQAESRTFSVRVGRGPHGVAVALVP